jgi:DNA-binding CsgD family transcriptional regulator
MADLVDDVRAESTPRATLCATDSAAPSVADAVDALMADKRLDDASTLATETLAALGGIGTEDAGVTRQEATRLRSAVAHVALMQGRPGDAVAAARDAIDVAPVGDAHASEAHLVLMLGLLVEDDLAGARAAAQVVLSGDAELTDDTTLASALTTFGVIAWHEGRLADAVGLLGAATHRAARAAPARRRPQSRLALARLLGAIGEGERAEAEACAAALGIEATNDVLWAPAPAAFLARILLADGRLDEAASAAQAALDQAGATGVRIFVPFALSTLTTVHVLRGDMRAAATTAADMDAEAPRPSFGFGGATFAWSSARVCEARDGSRRAFDLLAPLYAEIGDHRRLLVEEPGAAPWLVRIAVAQGDQRRAAVVVGAMTNLANDNRTFPSVMASARHARGLLANDAEVLERAAAEHVHPWTRASAAEDAGVARAGDGDYTHAQPSLEMALGTYEKIGALRDAKRVHARLQRVWRRRGQGRQARPTFGWASLTDTEHRVVDLVAEGLTNRHVAAQMCLSRHTVDFHLRQVFRKLDVQSRVQLTRLVLERPTTKRGDQLSLA